MNITYLFFIKVIDYVYNLAHKWRGEKNTQNTIQYMNTVVSNAENKWMEVFLGGNGKMSHTQWTLLWMGCSSDKKNQYQQYFTRSLINPLAVYIRPTDYAFATNKSGIGFSRWICLIKISFFNDAIYTAFISTRKPANLEGEFGMYSFYFLQNNVLRLKKGRRNLMYIQMHELKINWKRHG